MIERGELSEIVLTGGWETFLEGSARTQVEAILPRFLAEQRWFGGKARPVNAVRFVDWAKLLEHAWLVLIEVEFADGVTDLYFLPLAVATKVDPAQALAHLTSPEGKTILYDALANSTIGAAFLDAMETRREFATRLGSLRAFPTAAFASLRGDASLEAKPAPATSSNTLVMYGSRLMMKLFRRLEVGVNPDFEIGRFLTESGRFQRIPKTAGALEYHRPGQPPVTLAILQELIQNEGDGWRYTQAELSRYFERARQHGHIPANEQAIQEMIGNDLHAAGTLGRRTAEMHLALADAGDPAFAPEAFTPIDVTAIFAAVSKQAQEALTTLRGNLDRLPAAIRPQAQRLLEEGQSLVESFGKGLADTPAAAKIRCHGDYHLGQVLCVQGDFILIDFEGEPTRTVEERRAKQSPLKDVAGMLRSFDYAAYAGLFAAVHDHPDAASLLEPWAAAWQQQTSAAFLHAYQTTVAQASFLPHDATQFQALLRGFMLEKAFYELVYELNNRPDWVRIPLQGILGIAKGDSCASPS